MKLIALLTSVLVSVSAFGDGVKTHDYSQVLNEIKLENACLTESEVKSIKPVTICTQLEPRQRGSSGEEGTYIEWVCVEYQTKNLTYPRVFDRPVCLKHAPYNEASSGECLKWGIVEDFLPETIKTRKIISRGDYTIEKFGHFTFPYCE